MLGDAAALESELVLIIDVLQHIAEVSFRKSDVMPTARLRRFIRYLGKTVAPFAGRSARVLLVEAVRLHQSPHVMDAFLRRSKHDTGTWC